VRCLITGIDSEGLSCVVETVEVPEPQGPVDVFGLFRTHTTPPPPRPPGRDGLHSFGVKPGRLHWVMTRWAPGADTAEMHHTDTIDLDLVLSGSIDLILYDGTHRLQAGDAAVINGVDHGWRAGPEGALMSYVLLGTEPPAETGWVDEDQDRTEDVA